MTSFYLTVAIKLALGLISLVFVINLTGKGNLAPSSATDQVPPIYRDFDYLDDFDFTS